MIERRPLPISVLSIIAFVVCPFLITLAIRLVSNIFSDSEMPPRWSADFISTAIVLALFCGSFFLLSFVSIVAGRDLWKLRNRGRKLASVSMVLWLLLGAVLVAIGWQVREVPTLVFGGSLSLVAALFLVYLQLRAVRGKFTS